MQCGGGGGGSCGAAQFCSAPGTEHTAVWPAPAQPRVTSVHSDGGRTAGTLTAVLTRGRGRGDLATTTPGEERVWPAGGDTGKGGGAVGAELGAGAGPGVLILTMHSRPAVQAVSSPDKY